MSTYELVTVWACSIAAFLIFGVMVLLYGCGATEQRTAHAVLNTITDVADPTYQLAVDTCDAFRDAIIARQGTTYAEDRAAMDRIHEVCDPMIVGFEALRSAQLTARAAIDGGLAEVAGAAVREALHLWDLLRGMIPHLAQLGQAPVGATP